MQQKVDKYIYFISENRYRIKFSKVDKKTNMQVKFDEYIQGTLEDAVNLRDEKLEEYNISVNNSIDNNKIEKVKNKTVKIKKSDKKENYTKVDKYIYEIEKDKKYRIFIKKGTKNGNNGIYYSDTFVGNLARAKKERDKQLAILKLQTNTERNSYIKFYDFVKIYIKSYVSTLSPTTRKSIKCNLKNYLLPRFEKIPLNKIDVLMIQNFINELKFQGKMKPGKNGIIDRLSSSSINEIYKLIRKILNKAVTWGYLETNPVNKIKAPNIEKKEKETYTRKELLQILEYLKQEDVITEATYNIAICAGLRRSEILGLHLDDLDLVNGNIYIKRDAVWDDELKMVVEKETKTKDSVRKVPIPLFCCEAIYECIKLRERIIHRFEKKYFNYIAPDNIFLSKFGKIMHPDTISSKWTKFCDKYDEFKNISLHGLRHSYCTLQMNENRGLSASDVKKLMGHSQLSTTFRYTHSNEDKNKQTLEIFDNFYNFDKERKINFNQMLSLYTDLNFVSSKEIKELFDFSFSEKISENEKHERVKDYINNKYPFFKSIDVTKINLENVCDILEEYKQKYGDEFILTVLN